MHAFCLSLHFLAYISCLFLWPFCLSSLVTEQVYKFSYPKEHKPTCNQLLMSLVLPKTHSSFQDNLVWHQANLAHYVPEDILLLHHDWPTFQSHCYMNDIMPQIVSSCSRLTSISSIKHRKTRIEKYSKMTIIWLWCKKTPGWFLWLGRWCPSIEGWEEYMVRAVLRTSFILLVHLRAILKNTTASCLRWRRSKRSQWEWSSLAVRTEKQWIRIAAPGQWFTSNKVTFAPSIIYSSFKSKEWIHLHKRRPT